MDPIKARQLLNRLEKSGNGHVLTGTVPMDDNAKKVLGADGLKLSRGSKGVSDLPMQQALESDDVAWDDKAKKLVGTASGIDMDESIRPADHSKLFDSGIEQCMEFARRYFSEERAKTGSKDGSFGADWKGQYNIAGDVRGLANGESKVDGYNAFVNGGTVPPRAGDVLSMESPHADGEKPPNFHVCIVSKVFRQDSQWFVRVYEANVPLQVNDPDVKKHYEDIPMKVKNGTFTLDRAATSKKGYETDMDTVGWIHPTKPKALPGAVAKLDTGFSAIG